jgi:flagellar hook protein FlgE
MDDATLIAQSAMNEEILEPGSYSYYVSYYDPAGDVETRPTARIGTRTLSDPGGRVRIDLSQIEPPAASYTQVRIYRNTSDNDSQFLRVHSGTILATEDSYVDYASDDTLLSINEAVDLDGPPAIEGTSLVDLVVRVGDTYVNDFFEPGTLTFQAQKDGVDFDEKSLTVTADTTVLDLMNFIADASGIDTDLIENPDEDPQPAAGGVSLVDGQMVITSNLGEENALEIPLTSLQMRPTGETGTATIPITFTETQAANGPGTSTEFVVYDSLGSGLNVRITTVLETKLPNATIYRWYATSGDNEPFLSDGVSTVVGDGLLEFDAQGNLTSATSNSIAIQRNITASESPLEVELDFTQLSAKDVTNPQGDPISTINVTNQDGFPPGVLTDFVITDDGTIQGQYSNGTQRTIGQLVMARFANSGGLQQVGNSLFNVGVNSGNAIIGQPGSNGIGSLTAGAVELSNTDIGQNLIELILASTQYRGGARVITATQELLDELLALSR